jgi:glucosamine-6-phosphate deaminase
MPFPFLPTFVKSTGIMQILLNSQVEKSFYQKAGSYEMTTRLPYILVENFPKLGMLTALRFLEWVTDNPGGVISLPTGKTPEYFIKWTNYFLSNWNDDKAKKIREENGLSLDKKPELNGLQFVQIDEFYPISPVQHNSFNYYVRNFYIQGFRLDEKKALLIDCDRIPLSGGRNYHEVFPDNKVDYSLRYRECKTGLERIQQESIFMIDDWCRNYEQKIREKGGIGFFLGGIGPDGHIAFNVRGSDHYGTTRLSATNFETQAVAATDLGGIELSRDRLVITVGLDTITYNLDAVAIIIAAGEAKADVVRQALENGPSNVYPATAMQKLENSRFYVTTGAASRLKDSRRRYYASGAWNNEKTQKAILDLVKSLDKYGHHLSQEDLDHDPCASLIPGRIDEIVPYVEQAIEKKLMKGLESETNQVFLHTGPHHDDIMLGFLPHIAHHVRSHTNQLHFAILTSGFTAVTNSFVNETLVHTLKLIHENRIQMLKYPDFFTTGFNIKWDKDVYHYLDNVASGNETERKRGLSHRIVRAFCVIYGIKSTEELVSRIKAMIDYIVSSYDGEKNTPDVQKLKGMIREFEEELIWAHYGVQIRNIHHLRLGFYTGDIFTEVPDRLRDVGPVLAMLREIRPTVISLALDPEGSGPDTHYKVLQTIAEAVRQWSLETDLSGLRIWGYRNVWYRFHPAEANVFVPCSLNSLAMLEESFKNCYLSQVDASFPSYELDGPFSKLARKIWVEQLKWIQLMLGKNYFYENSHPRIRAAHGLVFFKEMKINEFLGQARELERSTEG